jgi:esterase/lipase superfamily enzyme
MSKASMASIAGLALVLSACSLKPSPEVLLPQGPAAGAEKSVLVLTATTRDRAPDSPYLFTAGRAASVNYQEYVISVPPVHVVGHIEAPAHAPGDPRTEFTTVSSQPLSDEGFAAALQAQLASRRSFDDSVLVLVHGYNTEHEEAVLRGAELGADLASAAGAVVVFSWPSRNDLADYVTDKESVTYSRDYLEQVLNRIASVPNVRSINLVAHSMGNWLAVETLRQAKLRAHAPFLGKLNQVVLLAPDIDVDVFRTQLDAIGRLRRPILIAFAKDDQALAASQRVAGDVPRVGNVPIDDPRVQAAIKRYDLRAVDLSQVQSSDFLGHSKFADVVPELQSIAAGNADRSRGLQGAGVFVLNATGKILSAPAVIGDALQR